MIEYLVIKLLPMTENNLLYNFRISEDAASALERLPHCIDEANPISIQHRAELHYSIQSLWRLLTMERRSVQAIISIIPPFRPICAISCLGTSCGLLPF